MSEMLSSEVLTRTPRKPSNHVDRGEVRRKRGQKPYDPKTLERRRLVWQGYARGLTQQEIATELGVSQATVSIDLRVLEKQFREHYLGEMEALRLRETAALSDMADSLLDDYLNRGRSTKVAMAWLAVRQRMHALWGLDLPKKVAPTTPDGDEPYSDPGLDTLASRIDSIAARLRASIGTE